MSTRKVYIHIGMPRTATTFFQHELFPHLPEMEYYGLAETHYSEAFNKLQFSDDSLYDRQLITQVSEQWKSDKVILSNENFIGQSSYFNHINRTSIAKRLKEAFPDAKILLVLRNQIDLLASMYAINLQWKETRKIDEFIWEPFQKESKVGIGGPSASFYNTLEGYECLEGYAYLPLIELYKSLFETVEVLLFEDFIHQPKQFSSRLAHFFDVEEELIARAISDQPKMNSGVSERQAKKLAKLNKYGSITGESELGNKVYNKLKRTILQSKKEAEKPFFSPEKEAKLRLFFTEKNQELQEKYPEIGIQHYSKKYYID